MPLATYQQANFLGGEWSPFYQGRTDHPKYRTGMNKCRNGFPMEEGAWVRRPGTRLKAPTYMNNAGKLIPVEFKSDEPYDLEFTNSYMRFFQGHELVYTTDGAFSVTAVSTANPAEITLGSAATWATGDEIFLFFASDTPSGGLPLRQRSFIVTKVDTTHFTLTDGLTGSNIDGSTLSMPGAFTLTARRVLRIATPYSSGSWANCKVIQNQELAIILNPAHPPYVLTITPGSTAGEAEATLTEAAIQDGPYLDIVPNSYATGNGSSGEITITFAFGAWDSTKVYGLGEYVSYSSVSYKSILENNLNQQPDTATTYWEVVDDGVAVTGAQLPEGASYYGFQSTDVGRHIRIWSTPPEWDSTVNYTQGDHVTRDGQAYVAGTENTDEDPVHPKIDESSEFGLVWAPVPGYQWWTWGTISVVNSTTSVNVMIRGDRWEDWFNEVTPRPTDQWRLGAWSDTTGYPSCGCFYEGRFWFGGQRPHRFDTTKTQGFNKDGIIEFAPTLTDGSVTDDSGITYTLQSKQANDIFWFDPDENDLICGTLGGEWMLQASSVGEPITPTSIRARRVTKYGCANIDPIRTGLSLIFVQKYQRRVMEFLPGVFAGRYAAPHLNEKAKHLTTDGVTELSYQEELAPIVWCRIGN